MCLRIVEIYVSTNFHAYISMHIRTWLEITGTHTRGQLLSMVLRRIGCLRTMVLWENAKSGIMRGSVEHIKESLAQETQGL